MVMGNTGRAATTTSKVSVDDVGTIMANEQYIETATASVSGSITATYGKESGSYTVLGALPNQFDVSNLNLVIGEIFTDEDNTNREKVAILGSTVVDDLFDGDFEAAMGQSITLGSKRFDIIGVLEETGSTMGPMFSYDSGIYVPFDTAEKNLLGNNARVMITVLADDVDVLDLAFEELGVILREAHGLKEGKEDDFRLMDAGSMVGAAQSTASTMTILLTSVAAIVLIVSGVGIMNVMFVTVAERTKEIGVAKAIGGKQSDILLQFLLESVLLSVIGGVIGIIIGQSILPLVASISNMSVAGSLWGIMLAFGFSVFVGIFFGFYPALKASKLDPVDALRSE